VDSSVIEQTTGNRKRILLADDEQAVREIIRVLLDLDEHIVVEATNGEEALSLFTPGRFDLVITDNDMPKMQGDELVARVKRLAPGQPILMITGSARTYDGLEPVADIILNKPFDLAELRQAVAELC
jgi:CheY-like chemotaxis protein